MSTFIKKKVQDRVQYLLIRDQSLLPTQGGIYNISRQTCQFSSLEIYPFEEEREREPCLRTVVDGDWWAADHLPDEDEEPSSKWCLALREVQLQDGETLHWETFLYFGCSALHLNIKDTGADDANKLVKNTKMLTIRIDDDDGDKDVRPSLW